jgi:hypothetical protein
LDQDTYIHTHVYTCMGNQGKKAVGVIVIFVFFVSVLDKTCQVDVVSTGICMCCVRRVVREKGFVVTKEWIMSRRQLRRVVLSFAVVKLLHQGEDRKPSVVREVFLRNAVRLRSVVGGSLEF